MTETLTLPQLEKEGWIGLHPLIKDKRLISLGFFFCCRCSVPDSLRKPTEGHFQLK